MSQLANMPRKGQQARSVQRTDGPHEADREVIVRNWIASREGICPYAPGAAHFTQLPPDLELDKMGVSFATRALQAFYDARDHGKAVNRWILLPHEEWSSHERARAESETIYWLFVAAYFELHGNKTAAQQALKRQMPGSYRSVSGDIINPVVGELRQEASSIPNDLSLFCTALSPIYRSEHFYRWAPTSMLVMVYAQDFMQKKKHSAVVNQITREMIRGNLIELWGPAAQICLGQLEQELPAWEKLIGTSLLLFQKAASNMGSLAEVMERFSMLNPIYVNALCKKNQAIVPTLNCIVENTSQDYFTVLNSLFSGSGLYVTPNYRH